MSESKTGYAQVTGVLKYNNSTREEMLRRNYWKDEEYTKYGAGIGEYHKIETRLVSPIGEGVSLYDYTQNENSEYGKEINKKYIPSNIEKENYETTPLMQDMHKWEGNYVDTFNDNNKLGEVGDAKYLQLMTFAGYANSDRFLSEKYLTPGLASFYGSNPQIEGENGYFNVFNRVGGVYKHESGRIAEIAEANVAKIIEFAKVNAKDNGGLYYLNQNLENAQSKDILGKEEYKSKYNIAKGEEYVEYSREEDKELGNVQIKDGKSIFDKTSQLFAKHKEQKIRDFIDYRNPYGNDAGNEDNYNFDSGKNYQFGHSHGRNLLKLGANSGDTNPFCRNWYWNHQYEKYSDLMRPFADGSDISDIQYMNRGFRAVSGSSIVNGGKYLSDNTVLNNNGYVNITPSLETESQKAVDIKKCMFSIENLAWKDVNKNKGYLSKEQQGPNGGRIMWFPPYDLEFQENVQVDWDSNSFIGRGEKVYTYKNTDRTGTLSFTMLIDHPNIINELKNKSGMEPDYNLEEDVLRFFAGNKILKLKEKQVVEEDTQQVSQTDKATLVPSEDKTEKIIFYVFFPNNYSGNEDPMRRPFLEKLGYSSADWFRYLLQGKGISTYSLETGKWCGYEMSDEGLSDSGNSGEMLIMSYKNSCHAWEIDGTPIESEDSFYYRTDFDMRGKLNYSKNYSDTKSYKLNSVVTTSTGDTGTSINSELLDANYSFGEIISSLYYEDKDLLKHVTECGGRLDNIKELNELLQSNPNFISLKVEGKATKQGDSKGCKYSEVLAYRRALAVSTILKDTIFKNKKINTEISTGETEELKDKTDINSKEAKMQRCVRVEIAYNPPTTKKISDKEGGNILSTTNESGETTLNEFEYEAEYEEEDIDYDVMNKADELKISYELLSKYLELEHCSIFDIEGTKAETAKHLCTFAKEVNVLDNLFTSEDRGEIDSMEGVLESMKNDNIIYTYKGKLYTDKLEELDEKLSGISGTGRTIINKEYSVLYDEYIKEYERILLVNYSKFSEEEDKDLEIEENLEEEINKELEDIMSEISERMFYELNADNTANTRYETEAEYFEKLNKESPFVFNSIIEKFKYFSPAFHSISPEGFNARLNFLHQCTRQGHTIESSSNNGWAETASNLSFGRMPVCVLRIGDFINTRILIQSLTINYDNNGGIQWDLNPEGAGVQPMYAKINLGIVILGGQSLEGPINRLQNAVSFDYYANTGVYDNRADRVSIENGKTNYKYLWTPSPEDSNN